MIYDACLFSGERDMLELRFRTLRDVVDPPFIVCACSRTHQGQALDRKPIEEAFLAAGEAAEVRAILWWVEPSLTLVRNGKTYERSPDERGPVLTKWFQHVERQHRDGVVQAVRSVTSDPNAIVMVSDVDELPNPEVVRGFNGYFAGRTSTVDESVLPPPSDWLCCAQRFHSTALDLLHPQQPWWGTCVSTLGNLRPQAQRDARTTLFDEHPTCTRVDRGGWHISWCGSDAERQRKLETFSHAELAAWDPVEGRRTRRHINGEPLHRITLEESYRYDWPAPLLTGEMPVPAGWLSEDAWTAEPERPAG